MKKVFMIAMLVWAAIGFSHAKLLTEFEMTTFIQENKSSLQTLAQKENYHMGYAVVEFAKQQMVRREFGKDLEGEKRKREHLGNVITSALHGIGFGGISTTNVANDGERRSAYLALYAISINLPQLGNDFKTTSSGYIYSEHINECRKVFHAAKKVGELFLPNDCDRCNDFLDLLNEIKKPCGADFIVRDLEDFSKSYYYQESLSDALEECEARLKETSAKNEEKLTAVRRLIEDFELPGKKVPTLIPDINKLGTNSDLKVFFKEKFPGPLGGKRSDEVKKELFAHVYQMVCEETRNVLFKDNVSLGMVSLIFNSCTHFQDLENIIFPYSYDKIISSFLENLGFTKKILVELNVFELSRSALDAEVLRLQGIHSAAGAPVV
jgi:hypothetical protein